MKYSFPLQGKYNFSVGLGQAITQKKRPEVDPNYYVLIRDQNEFRPLGEVGFTWDEDDFPRISFEPKESIYMNFDLFVLYNFNSKNKFKFSAGPIFSLRDHSQIDIYVIKYESFASPVLENVAIPVYSYASYLDLGLLTEVKYTLKKVSRLDIDAVSRFKYYPKNGTFMVEIGVNFGINLKKNKS